MHHHDERHLKGGFGPGKNKKGEFGKLNRPQRFLEHPWSISFSSSIRTFSREEIVGREIQPVVKALGRADMIKFWDRRIRQVRKRSSDNFSPNELQFTTCWEHTMGNVIEDTSTFCVWTGYKVVCFTTKLCSSSWYPGKLVLQNLIQLLDSTDVRDHNSFTVRRTELHFEKTNKLLTSSILATPICKMYQTVHISYLELYIYVIFRIAVWCPVKTWSNCQNKLQARLK